MKELKNKLIYKGTTFIFNTYDHIVNVAKKLERTGECPGIMNTLYIQKTQDDGTKIYIFK